jgi:hypothetical protein
MEDLTVKLGLLMEAAERQQALAADALERLREHTGGLDAVVREEIRATLIEELGALSDEVRSTTQALQALQRAAGLRIAVRSAALSALTTLVPLACAWWLLPSRAEVAALRSVREDLSGNVTRLAAQGGRVELRHCGSARRLCVRVDRGAPLYGEAADFLVVKGY